MRALGIHAFAGGFTRGVMKRAGVVAQLEIHDFGGDSVRAIGIPFINASSWQEWPRYDDIQLVYGNPRCTGFSTITSGYDDTTHGPWAKQTRDIHDLCSYAVAIGADVVVWESVQQAYSVGRPLLDYLRDELFVPKGYRIAHVFVCAAAFGNAQTRRRYFFVAYRDHNFNVTAPVLSSWHATVRDAISHLSDRKTRPARLYKRDEEYDGDCYTDLTPDEWLVVPHLPQGHCMNRFARERHDELRSICPKFYRTWARRASDLPFSLHCINRIAWDRRAPTLHSSSSRCIHPSLHRPLTVRELAAIMGWDDLPSGYCPIPQIAKGVVPAVGTWLAEQAQLHLDDAWGADDWDTRYDHHEGVWRGRRYTDSPTEKTLDLTHYYPAIKEIGNATV